MTADPVPCVDARSPDPEREQFPLLVRSFLQRLFENDLLPEGVDIRQSVIWLAALFAAPGILSLVLLTKYMVLGIIVNQFPERLAELERATWGDELFFLLYSMTAVGFLTVLVWESVFPDARDMQVLGSLPVRGRTVVFAKLTSLVLFVGVFAFAINLPAAFAFTFALNDFGSPAYLFTHMTVTPLAGLFVFVCLIAMQTTLAALVHERLLHPISMAVQLLFVVALIELLVYSVTISSWLAEQAQTLADSGAGSWLPPLWFLGLYETLIGSDLQSFHRLAATALTATMAALGLGIVAYAIGYRRIVRRALENPHPAGRQPGMVVGLACRVWPWVTRDPTQQAVVAFVGKSLARSRRHRLLLAIYLGVALAFILRGFISAVAEGVGVPLHEPTAMLLSIPLVLSFFTLVGLRVLFAVPIELPANWVFQMTERDDKTAYLAGTRTALVLLGLVPLALVTLPLYWAIWGPVVAIGHTTLWMLLGALLVEALVTGFRKVPFACSYLPGKANFKLLAIPYLVVMLIYGYTTAWLELSLLAEPQRWLLAAGVLAAGLVATRVRHRVVRQRVSTPPPRLTYEEAPDDTVRQLGLMPRV